MIGAYVYWQSEHEGKEGKEEGIRNVGEKNVGKGIRKKGRRK